MTPEERSLIVAQADHFIAAVGGNPIAIPIVTEEYMRQLDYSTRGLSAINGYEFVENLLVQLLDNVRRCEDAYKELHQAFALQISVISDLEDVPMVREVEAIVVEQENGTN